MFDPITRRSPGLPLQLNTTTPTATSTTSSTSTTTATSTATIPQSTPAHRDDPLEKAKVLHTGPTTSPENRYVTHSYLNP